MMMIYNQANRTMLLTIASSIKYSVKDWKPVNYAKKRDTQITSWSFFIYNKKKKIKICMN